MPERKAQLISWLHQDCELPEFDFTPASGDASFRRYFRVALPDGQTLIAMDAPPDKEDCRPFIEMTDRLAATGVHVPKILQQDLDQGFLLLEDLGDQLYLPALNTDSVEQLYREAVDALLTFQQKGNTAGLPDYDEALLRREMQLFPDWLLQTHLQLDLAPAEQQQLDQSFAALVEAALAQPKVFVHRDYHSRNLMITGQGEPGIIDYQDAVFGPLTYDLVSLLRDCYISWPAAQVDAWVEDYAQRAQLAGLLAANDAERLLEWFDLMGVQRHLKAAGIFARLNHRDGKPGYLADIPRTLGYIVEVGQRRPAMSWLAGFIQQRVLPGLQ